MDNPVDLWPLYGIIHGVLDALGVLRFSVAPIPDADTI